MKVSIKTIRGMVMVSIDGPMAIYIMDNLLMNWDKGRAKWYGTQVKFMKDIGEMGYRME